MNKGRFYSFGGFHRLYPLPLSFTQCILSWGCMVVKVSLWIAVELG